MQHINNKQSKLKSQIQKKAIEPVDTRQLIGVWSGRARKRLGQRLVSLIDHNSDQTSYDWKYDERCN